MSKARHGTFTRSSAPHKTPNPFSEVNRPRYPTIGPEPSTVSELSVHSRELKHRFPSVGVCAEKIGIDSHRRDRVRPLVISTLQLCLQRRLAARKPAGAPVHAISFDERKRRHVSFGIILSGPEDEWDLCPIAQPGNLPAGDDVRFLPAMNQIPTPIDDRSELAAVVKNVSPTGQPCGNQFHANGFGGIRLGVDRMQVAETVKILRSDRSHFPFVAADRRHLMREPTIQRNHVRVSDR